MSPPDYNTQLITVLLDWLWRSWISFGISGHGSAARVDRVIDPEALVLAGSLWARYDARLFDEMLDWLCLHGGLIHLQRLRNLHRIGVCLRSSPISKPMKQCNNHTHPECEPARVRTEMGGHLKQLGP